MSENQPVDPANSNPQNEEWEMHLLETARAFPYPPTPDIASAVLRRRRSRPIVVRRGLLWAAIIVLVSLCALMAVPQVRAAVLEFLRIGAVRILIGEPTATTLPGTPSAQGSATPLRSVLDLYGETTLADAQNRVDFPIRLPSYPSNLGRPDHVFVQFYSGAVVVLVWMDPAQPDRVRLSLHQLENDAFAMKGVPRVIEETTVHGRYAVWTLGPYVLEFVIDGRRDLQARRLVSGHVLIWEESGITYRLETDVSLEEAIKIAESLR